MAFDAGKVVEALDWSWRPYVDLSGTVPEPTDDEVREMNSRLRAATVKVTGENFDPEDRKALTKAFSKLTDEQLKKMDEDNLAAIAIVTKNSPSLEQLKKCPPRVKGPFIRWLIQELNDPEGRATATKP
jgi:hypothetical protein